MGKRDIGSRKVLLFGWDGGGNVAPLVALGKRLRRRGHQVRMVGSATMAERAETAGIAFEPFFRPPSWSPQPGRSLEDDMERFAVHVLGPELGEELLAAANRSKPDALVIDCMAGGALSVAEHLDIPAAVLVHLRARFHYDAPSGSEITRPAKESLNRQRERLGLETLPVEESWWGQLWQRAGTVFVASLPELEGPGTALPASFTYVGGIFDPEPEPLPEDVAMCVRQDREPLVVISLSTTYTHQEPQLATAMAALGGQRGIITIGPGLDIEDLDPPAGVIVARWVAHESLLPHADVVVTHAGHGTVIAALTCGVPLVCMPMGRDQHGNAEQVARLGAGVCVDAAVDTLQLRAAINEVLSDPSYRAAAAILAKSLGELGGGDRLAGSIESLMAAPAATTRRSTIRKGS